MFYYYNYSIVYYFLINLYFTFQGRTQENISGEGMKKYHQIIGW